MIVILVFYYMLMLVVYMFFVYTDEFCIYKQGQVEYTCRYWNDAAFTGIDINGTDSSQFPEIPCNSSVEGNTLKRTCYLDISIASNSNFSCVIKDTISPDPPTGNLDATKFYC